MTEVHLLDQLNRLFDQKLEPIYKRLDSIENRLDSVENRLDSVENRLDGMENRLDGVENRLDNGENIITPALEEIRNRLTTIELIQENRILPCLEELSTLYKTNSEKFLVKGERIEQLETDIDILKKVTQKHSQQLEQLMA